MSASRKLIMISACRIRHLRNQQHLLRELDNACAAKTGALVGAAAGEEAPSDDHRHAQWRPFPASSPGQIRFQLWRSKSDSKSERGPPDAAPDAGSIDCIGAQEIPMPLGTPPATRRPRPRPATRPAPLFTARASAPLPLSHPAHTQLTPITEAREGWHSRGQKKRARGGVQGTREPTTPYRETRSGRKRAAPCRVKRPAASKIAAGSRRGPVHEKRAPLQGPLDTPFDVQSLTHDF